MNAKRMIGELLKIMMVGAVLLFLGIQSLNFFEFMFKESQWYYAYLGFFLTSVGVVIYLVVFKTVANTPLQRNIAAAMMLVCVLGELATAGYGMRIEAWAKLGFELTESDFDFMVLVVQILALLHGIAWIGYYVGDDLARMFSDDDKDGIPNAFDKDYKRPKNQVRSFANDTANPTQERKRE